MTTYTAIPNADIDPDSPVTAALMTLMRDNPLAIQEGDATAPKITDAALSTTATSTGLSWVSNRIALSSAGGIGTYAMLRLNTNNTAVVLGTNYAGSGLRYDGYLVQSGVADALHDGSAAGTTPSGTWKAMGEMDAVTNQQGTTVFLRVA